MRRPAYYVLFALLLCLGAAALIPSAAAQERPRTADEEFVPIDELPPDERLPAAPFLIAAYSIAWIVVIGYLWSIWQRLSRVEREMQEVSQRLARTRRPPGSAPPHDPAGRAPGSRHGTPG